MKTNVLVISIASDETTYKNICLHRNTSVVEPAQSFFRKLIEGFASIENVEVETISIRPYSRSNTNSRSVTYEEIRLSEKLIYKYVGFSIGIFSRPYTQMISVYKQAKKWINQTWNCKERYIFLDPLLWHVTTTVRMLCKHYGIHCIPVVTDLPIAWLGMNKRKGIKRLISKIYNYIAEKDLKKYQAYVLLTEQMKDVINRKGKPYIVIEGMVEDIRRISPTKKCKKIIYGGGIYNIFKLVELASEYSKISTDYTLCFYGSGDCVDSIKKIAETSALIKYCGVVSNMDMMSIEADVYLLINPRPINDNYTKYSFPSKILEYMSSGTPVITTHLPGIPEDYDKYLYYFSSDEPSTMANEINELIKHDILELVAKGQSAREYVLDQKLNSCQARKILDFCRSQLKTRKE